MEKIMDNVYRNIIIVSSVCGMIIACMITCQAAPSEDVIRNVAMQLESGKTEFSVGYILEENETEQEAIHDILKMVRNYSDDAAKVSFNMCDYSLAVNGSSIISARFEYAVERDDQEALNREFDRMYGEICDSIHNYEIASKRRKMNAILAYMAREFSYGFKNERKEKYGLLESITQAKVMTCTSYSEIIDELCERMDIECRIIVNEGHAWNYIKLSDDDTYIQIDGTMKYIPYVTYDDMYHKFDYLPMDEVTTASIFDNIIFWHQCFPLILYTITGVLILAIGAVIKKRYHWKKFRIRHVYSKNYKNRNIYDIINKVIHIGRRPSRITRSHSI